VKIDRSLVDEFYERNLGTLILFNDYIAKLINKVTAFKTREITLGASEFQRLTSTMKKLSDFLEKFEPFLID
jgi:hypothetical protein